MTSPVALPDPATAVAWPRRTERCVLRLITRDDTDAVWSFRRLPEVTRYLTHESLTKAEVAQRIAERVAGAPPIGGRLLRGVAVDIGGRLAGDAMLRVQADDGGRPELWIGYAFHPDVHGHGFATEVARELVAVGREIRLPVSADAYEDNTASLRVLAKAGLVPVGTDEHDGRTLVVCGQPGAPRV
ncbi:MAG: GNAT family N-acetyltransferase [Dermatophilaceae bacterium]